jgi:TonB family protein
MFSTAKKVKTAKTGTMSEAGVSGESLNQNQTIQSDNTGKLASQPLIRTKWTVLSVLVIGAMATQANAGSANTHQSKASSRARGSVVGTTQSVSMNSVFKRKATSIWGAQNAVSASVKRERRIKRRAQLSSATLVQAIGEREGLAQSCYEQELKQAKKLSGSLDLNVQINEQGRVSTVEVVGGTMPESALTRCMVDGVSQWSFPVPASGTAEVELPFVFERR